MAKGQMIDELYIGLNLDINQLELDFETAGKTVQQTISRLNSEAKQIRLKADIDLSKLEGAGTAVDKLKVKEQSLTQQIDIQTKKMNILAAAYQSAQEQYGKDSGLTRKAGTSLLYQQREVERLRASLRGVQSELAKATQGSGIFDHIARGAGTAKDGVDKLAGSYGLLSGKMTALLAVATTGAGLFNITQSAMEAGENLYKLSNRLHMTTREAAELSRLFAISGTNIQGVIPFFSQLDKQVLASGSGLNTTALAMMEFGISLKDANGNLLPINEQLEQLAAGYQRAAEAGKLEEFQAQVLGRRGAELIPLLENYNDNMQIAASIKTTGLLNPQEAHELSIEWRAMKAEAGQLSNAFGAAMMPIAKDIMPEVTDGMKDLIQYIRDHKDEVRDSIETTGTALKDVLATLKAIASILPSATASTKIGEIKGKDNGIDRFKYTAENGGWLAKLPGIGVGLAEALDTNGVNESYLQSIQEQEKAQKAAAAAKKANATATDDLIKLSQELTQADKTESESEGIVAKSDNDAAQAANKNANAQLQAARAMKWRATAAGQLAEKIYALTHNDVENAQHAMWAEAEKAQANGVSQDLIDQFISAQSSRIAEDRFRNVTAPMAEAFQSDLQNQLDQIDLQAKSYVQAGASESEASAWANQRKSQINADWDREVAAQIDSIWQDSLTKRLAEIDRERQAWIKKGLDEVRATQWAEKEKLDAKRNAALEVLRSQREEMQAYKEGGQLGLLNYLREANGIDREDLKLSQREVADFTQARQTAMEHLLPGFAPDDDLRRLDLNHEGLEAVINNLGETILREHRQELGPDQIGPVTPGNAGDLHIETHVHIDNAVTEDSASMDKLADNISDRIVPTVQSALEANSNAY